VPKEKTVDWSDALALPRTTHQQLVAAEAVRGELLAPEQKASSVEVALSVAESALGRAAERETELQTEVKKLSVRMEQQAEMLAGQARGARNAAYESAQAATTQLEESAAVREVEAVAARELSLRPMIESAEISLEKEVRERRQLERLLDEANSKCAALASKLAEVAASREAAMREELDSTRRRAEEAELMVEHVSAALKLAEKEARRQPARADGADAEAQRTDVRARRAVPIAEADRDSIALRLAQRGEAADTALADAAHMEARVRAENEAVTRFSAEEVGRLKQRGLRGALPELARS